MTKVIKYKTYGLITNKLVYFFVIILLLLTNIHAIFSSGVLLSGGANFNGELKYELILNNYLLISSLYGLFFSIYLGSNIIGSDINTGNIQLILTSYPAKWKYYIGAYMAALFFMLVTQFLIILNVVVILSIFDIPFIIFELLECFLGTVLNSAVVLSVTGIASVFLEGHFAILVGLSVYTFYSIYMYNTVPFVNTYFIFNMTQYRDILCNFAPITNLLPSSYTDPEIMEFYKLVPIIPNIYLYQLVYCFFAMFCGAFGFQRREV